MAGDVVELIRNAPLEPPTTGPAPGITAQDPCNHLAQAQRLKREYGDRLLYVDGIGWHTWAPPWKFDPHGAAEMVHALGNVVAAEAAAMAAWVAEAPRGERAQREAAMADRFKWARKCESDLNIQATLNVAKDLMHADAAQLDADPDLLGCPDGVLDLRTLQFRGHTQTDLMTKVTGCNPAQATDATAWQTFIGQIFDGDAELIDWVQRFCGYCLTGNRNEHLLPVFWGGGSNGKSTFVETLQAALGSYAASAAPDLLLLTNQNQDPAIAQLQGQRFVVCAETGDGRRMDESRVKMLTGGDTISAKRLYHDRFTFKPTHQLVLMTNHKPVVSGTDYGLWRRLRLIPFTRKFEGADRDPDLPAKLRAEIGGILTWCVQGYAKYRQRGLGDAPAAVLEATKEYRTSSDTLAQFLADKCELDPQFSCKSSALYAAFKTWCEETGERRLSKVDFGRRMAEHGMQTTNCGFRGWRGVRVRAEVEPGEVPF